MTENDSGFTRIVNAALELPPTARGEFLDQACHGDSILRQRVDDLLAKHDQTKQYLQQTGDHSQTGNHTGTFEPRSLTGEHVPSDDQPQAFAPARRGKPSSDSAIGTVIAGRYKLVDVIGEGGMGSVYLAEQTEPVKRQVALKLIKTGMDSKGVLARFDAERQALALMNHPNIARIYDGGLTPPTHMGGSPVPFFVMELVKGVPLTEYCDGKRLSVDARLQLFVQVCYAVQHAHQKGIIHRDLKPGNVLVTEVDGRPTPKVIDFGVAKATEQQLTDMSFSDEGAIVGTPAYMSPEQADPSSMDIDTRSDVYALGVILYELLVGSPPLEAKQFKRGALLEMLRMVREVEPPRPSTKLSTADARPNIAANRNIEPAKLSKLLQGELDWVVMKALEKDRTRRYDTANGFAQDIQRYLADEVVEARPPSRSYRLKKFVRRNKVQVIAASLVLMALIVAVVGTSLGLLEARRSAEAERQAKIKEEQKRQEAEKNLEFSRKGNAILGSVFENLDANQRYATVAEFRNAIQANLTLALQNLEGASIGDPLTVAEMQQRLGNSMITMAAAPQAIPLLEKARDTQRELLGADNPITLTTMNRLGLAYRQAGNIERALSLFSETWEARKRVLGPDHEDTLTSLTNLALALQNAGKIDRSVELFQEALTGLKSKLGLEHRNTIICMNNLGTSYFALGKKDLALSLFEETLQLRKKHFSPSHPETLTSMNNLAQAYLESGRIDLSIPLCIETIQLQTERLGPTHAETLITKNNLGLNYLQQGKLDLAESILEETYQQRKATIGPDHPDTLRTMGSLAAVYRSTKNHDKAIQIFEETIRQQTAKLGRDHPHRLLNVLNLGIVYKEAGRLKDAIPLLEEAHQYEDRVIETRFAGVMLLEVYLKTGERVKTPKLLQEQVAQARKTFSKDSLMLAKTLGYIGTVLYEERAFAEAEPLLRESLDILDKVQPNAWGNFTLRSMLGGVRMAYGKHSEAEALLLAGYEGLKRLEKELPPQAKTRIPEALNRLIEFYTATKKPDEVKKWRAERAKYPLDVAPMPRTKK